MPGMLEQRRAALFAELPVPLANRRDRLRRVVAMLEENSGALGAAIEKDRPDLNDSSAGPVEIEQALAALRKALRHLAGWMRPEHGPGIWARLVRGGDHVEYQPLGVVGIAVPPALAFHRTLGLIAGALAAGNRVVMRFDPASAHMGELLAELAPRYLDPLVLHILDGQTIDATAFAELPFDLLVTSDTGDAPALTGLVRELSGKTPAIIGRSADFAKAAEQAIASKLVKAGHVPLTPDYLLVPAEHEEAIAGWLWRAAMHLHRRMAGHTEIDLPLSDSRLARFDRLIDNARARGAEILVAEPPEGQRRTGVQHMPLHIVRHATDDMLVMQEEIRGPILPLRSYGDIDEAIDVLRRLAPFRAIHYFGRDGAERRHLVARTLSAAIALDGRSLAIVQADARQDAARLRLDTEDGEAGFRGFSRARRVFQQPALDIAWLTGAPSVPPPSTPAFGSR